MGLSEDADQENAEERFRSLCADLNIDKNTADEAWRNYEAISTNYTLEGDCIHWLCCALYVACRNSSVPTVGHVGMVEGNCVSLTQLRRKCSISMLDFFDKSRKWADMANLSEELRRKFVGLERNFEVCSVIFKKYDQMFKEVFQDPANDPPKPPRSRKSRKLPPTAKDIYDFTWAFFVRVKTSFGHIHEELVSCFHLLVACLDYVFGNALVANRRDLFNPSFKGLPADFNSRDYKPPTEPECIVECLYSRDGGQDERTVVDVKRIKTHELKPFIKQMMEKEVLKGNPKTLCGILDTAVFDLNKKVINNDYEDYVHRVGDFDERIFSSPDALTEIGTPIKSGFNSFSSAAAEDHHQPSGPQSSLLVYPARRNLQSQFDGSHHLALATPLTGRNFLKAKEPGSVTPVSTATQSVSRLQALVSGRATGPSEELRRIFAECATNPEEGIAARVKEMGAKFCAHYVSQDSAGQDMARKRLQLGESLYYKVLENIIHDEKRRLKPGADLSGILNQDMLHQLLITCCLEIVLFSYNSQRTFPWILEVFPIQPFYFYKVIEVLIRAEDHLSRDVVKHLNHMEEQILESMAWRYQSPLWDYLKNTEQPVPSCEEVSLPSQIYPGIAASAVPPSPAPQPAQNEASAVKSTPQQPIPYSPSTYVSNKRAESSLAASLLQSPLSSARPLNERTATPAQSSRRRLFPGSSASEAAASPAPDHPAAPPVSSSAVTASLPEKEPVKVEQIAAAVEPSQPSPCVTTTSSSDGNKPKRTGSLGLFFRKFYHLASVRLQDLCNRLELFDEDLRKKIWTCFEYSVMKHTDLMQDRHLDQILMCAVYVICKVTSKDKSFTDIMRCYRSQPHASSHVYRSVLLCTRARRGSASSASGSASSSASGGNNPSATPSPAPSDKEEEAGKAAQPNEDSKAAVVAKQPEGTAPAVPPVRSSSTLPFPQPSSCPPTPTGLAGTASSFEYEDRGDLILFYNTVYVRRIQGFALRFSNRNRMESLPLSPLPLQRPATLSPRRKVSAKPNIFISPLKATIIPHSPQQPMRYSFNRSPSKDLQAINAFLCEERSRKRPLFDPTGNGGGDLAMAPPPPKFPMTVENAVARKISFH